MDLSVFRAYLEDNRSMFEHWGRYVLENLNTRALDRGITPQIATFRVKEIGSALGKVVRKGYSDPIRQTSDVVGVRIVVLLSKDLDAVVEAVKTEPSWSHSFDRDPQQEVMDDPDRFGYKSAHFVVYAASDLHQQDGVVRAGTPCEVQVRTLLEHAYAEVVHDHIYKAAWTPPAKAKRFVASSAALIETTDHLFCETMRILEEDGRERNSTLTELMRLYTETIGGARECDEKLNLEVIDALEAYLADGYIHEIRALFNEKQFLVKKIVQRLGRDPFWTQPVVLLAYWLVSKEALCMYEKWPFASAHDALELVYSDLGASPQY